MRFGLIVNLRRDGARYAAEQAIEWIEQRQHTLLSTEALARSLGVRLETVPEEELASKIDIAIAIGGDGTLLSTARMIGDHAVPLLGINAGTLGFLTQVPPDEMIDALDSIAAGKYAIEERMMLETEVEGSNPAKFPYALNEIVIDNGPVSRLIRIHFRVNGEDIVTYQADGLTIATPTGSTAYSLAVGGPIMNPNLEGIIASPISSFSLTTRPMILAPNDELELRISSEHGVAGLTIDGQVRSELKDTDLVRIRKAKQKTKIITFRRQSFYRLVKSKLHWGLSPRGG